MMAQLIGNDTTTIWSSIKEIWNTEGIFGFFCGYTPKLICEVSCLVVASSATYMKKHFVRDREGHEYVGTFSNFIAATIFYPLHVVSSCMKVAGSRRFIIILSILHSYRSEPIFRGEIPFPKAQYKHFFSSAASFMMVKRAFSFVTLVYRVIKSFLVILFLTHIK